MPYSMLHVTLQKTHLKCVLQNGIISVVNVSRRPKLVFRQYAPDIYSRLWNDLHRVECDVELYYTMPGFYLATLCASVLFSRRPVPICLSHSCIVLKRIISSNFFLSHHYSFFELRRLYRFPTETPQRGREIHGVGKLAIFDWNRRLSRKRHDIGPWLLWKVNRKP